ncbi:MAG: M56 family metallopeptidase [Segetibacter sp.]
MNKVTVYLQHELTHVKQNHSADKLFLNIVLAACWVNPCFWIIRKELNMLHEFIADQKAISNGDTNAFATMLLTATYPQHSFVLTNSFFHSPIKRRLLMITTSKTTSHSYFRRLMILPLLALISILSAFTMEGKNIQELQKNDKKLLRPEYKGKTKEDLSKETAIASDTIEAKFVGGNQAWKRYLETNLNANVPTQDKAPSGVYTVKVQFIVTETGEIKDVSAIQTPARCPSCASEAVRIIKSGPKWEPMTIDGKNVTSQPVQFISFKVEEY